MCAAIALAASTRAQHARADDTTPAATNAAELPKYDFDAFVRVRYKQSWVSISPRLRSLVERQLSDPSLTAASLRAIADTARETDGITPTRAELRLHARTSPALEGELRLDAARLLVAEEAGQAVRELVARWTPLRPVALSVGIFALPFSLHELFEQRSFPLTDEGPSHALLEHLRFYGRDVGIMATLRPLRDDALSLDLAAADGGAVGAQDYRGPGLLCGRITAQPWRQLQLTSALSVRPHALDAWWEELRYRYQAFDRGAAVSTSAALFLGRWTLRAEWLAGKRTDNDVTVPVALRRGAARAFTALWAMASTELPVRGLKLVPVARAEWLDTDRDHPDVGELIHLSVGLAVDLDRHVRLTGELSRHLVQAGTRDFTFEILRYQADVTSGTLQLQLGL
ncbi:MAG TPA: hypothetical protein VHB79_01675 [Polyangiaceae bacterium]|nr:hypothetical protein [Polyangiaceae bacterium]